LRHKRALPNFRGAFFFASGAVCDGLCYGDGKSKVLFASVLDFLVFSEPVVTSIVPNRMFTRNLYFVSSLFFILLHSYPTKSFAQTDQWMPSDENSYWSFKGEYQSDDLETPLLLRQEIDSTVYVDGRRTLRKSQKVIPAFGEEIDSVDRLNPKIYENTNNGWHVYREEIGSRILEYRKAARVLPDWFELGESYKYKTRLNGKGGLYGIIYYHAVPIGFEEINLRNGVFEALKVNIEKRVKLASDERGEELIEESTEYTSSWFVKDVGLVKQHVTFTGVSPEESFSHNYSVELLASDTLPNYLWPEATYNDNGWKFVDWLGYLTDDHFPWIYHSDHGWLYVDAEDTTDVRLWSESLGWWFTSADLYPVFYAHELGEWLSFEGGDRVERRFVRENGTVITASTSGFLRRSRTGSPPALTVGSDSAQEGSLTFVDDEGNSYTNSGSGFEEVEDLAPTVSILHPFEGALAQEGEQVLLLADAVDSDGEIAFVKFLANGKLVEIVEEPPYRAVLIADGEVESYSIVAVAHDDFGNETTSDAIELEVEAKEMIEPKVRVSSPLNRSEFLLGKKIWVDVVASDPDGFLDSVYLLVDDIQVGDEQVYPPYRFGFIPPVTGSYSIGAIAIDDDGNESSAKEITINIYEEIIDEIEDQFTGPGG